MMELLMIYDQKVIIKFKKVVQWTIGTDFYHYYGNEFGKINPESTSQSDTVFEYLRKSGKVWKFLHLTSM